MHAWLWAILAYGVGIALEEEINKKRANPLIQLDEELKTEGEGTAARTFQFHYRVRNVASPFQNFRSFHIDPTIHNCKVINNIFMYTQKKKKIHVFHAYCSTDIIYDSIMCFIYVLIISL